MIHPLFLTLVRKPRLFLEHVDAYADLAIAEADGWRGHWQRRAAAFAAGGLLIVLGLGLAGVAGLLFAIVPLAAMPLPWLLGVIPLVPLLAGLALTWGARRMTPHAAFAALREQVSQDLATLRILEEER